MVPSCAGAYLSGAAGSNACPAGSVRIEAEAACRTVVTATGKTANPNFVQTNAFVPRGCYYTTGLNTAYLNTDAAGAGHLGSQLLCAVVTGAAQHAVARRALRHACLVQVGWCG